ncbi:MAG TPA: hypothetical protein PKD51_04295 [Saprospiraceae bacterium]|nr:hypothetical protein [Saprospiraceae bacterium]HMU02156.1 hypothetical protein [Saprospiraceae bacterium]
MQQRQVKDDIPSVISGMETKALRYEDWKVTICRFDRSVLRNFN